MIVYKELNGKVIKGQVFNIILNTGLNGIVYNKYRLVNLVVYANGDLDCLGPLSIDKLKELLKTGKLSYTLPPNEDLFISFIGRVIAPPQVFFAYTDEKFIRIIEETIERLNEDPSIESICATRFKEYLLNPSEEHLTQLKEAHSKLPPDKKAFFEVEYKDPLMKLMNGGSPLTKAERNFYLNDYFDGEWIEMQE